MVNLDRFAWRGPYENVYRAWDEYEPKVMIAGNCCICGRQIEGEMGFQYTYDGKEKVCWFPECREEAKAAGLI
jgi:hypothetical protein